VPSTPRFAASGGTRGARRAAVPIAEQSRPERVRGKRPGGLVRCGAQARSASLLRWVRAA
jgi:hypothetical protein